MWGLRQLEVLRGSLPLNKDHVLHGNYRDRIGFREPCSLCSCLEYADALLSLPSFDRHRLGPVICPVLMLKSEQGVRLARAVSRRAGPIQTVLSMN